MPADAGSQPMHAAIAAGLRQLSIPVLFGLTGSGNLFIAESFSGRCGGTFVRSAHEAGAVQMAQGYAKATGHLAAATVSMGPGVTNTLTGLVEGVRGRTPVLVVATDTPAEEKYHWQGVEQRGLVESTGAGFEPVRSARTALRDLAWAAQRAVVQSRPVLLNVPRDLLHEPVQATFQPASYPLRQPVRPAPAALEDLLAVVASARRPVVLAGRGALGAEAELIALAERIGAPLATTLKAKGLFRGSIHNIGIFGTLATDRAGELIARSDCILAFGASLNYRTTVGGDLLQGKRTVHCDIDPAAIGATGPVDVGVVGDCAQVASELRALCDLADVRASAFQDLAVVPAPAATAVPTPMDPDRELDATAVMSFLNEAVPGDRLVVTDGGNFSLAAWRHLDVATPTRFLTTTDFGAIGSGMGNAIGASWSAPELPVVLVVGDGGFTLGGLVEFNTAVRYDVDLITVVCNNGTYGPEYRELVHRGLDPRLSMFEWPDFASVAGALGGTGVTVRTSRDLEAAAKAIADRDRPLLIDVHLDPAADDSAMAVSAV